MTIYFRSCQSRVFRDKRDPRWWWSVSEFKTSGGVITLVRRIKGASVKRTGSYFRHRDGNWRLQPGLRKVIDILTRHRQNKRS